MRSILAVLVLALPGSAIETTFLLYDSATQKTVAEGDVRRRLSPCSTFKIPNTVIALESKVASDAGFTLSYDPKRDGPQWGAWSRDHDLRSALANSVVWYYRELARRVGAENMQRFVNQFGYGNRDISGGIDRFWLSSSLRISAEEQIDFLRRLNESRLGFGERSRSIVRDMLVLEVAPRYRWFGKTGMCTDVEHGPVVWHAGFVEREGRKAYYALNLTGGDFDALRQQRGVILRDKLSANGWIDAAPPSAFDQMRAAVEGAVSRFAGVVSLYAKNLDTGATYDLRGSEQVRTASTIKLPVMAAVFSAIEQGKARWDDTIVMRADDKVSGSGIIRELEDGSRLTIRDLVRLMIVVSDNTATNLLLDRFTADFVNAEMDRLGLGRTRVLRKILGDGANLKPVASGHSKEGLMPEFRRFGLGVSTPRDMVDLLEKIERGEVVSRAASDEMIAILRRQQYKDGIGRQLSDEQVASKSGALDRLRSDVGVVYSEGGRIALAVTVDDTLRTDYSPDNSANVLISDLAQSIVAGMSVPVGELSGPVKTVELQATMDHVQGIDVEGERLWVSWVDRVRRTGHLGEFDLASGRLLRSVEVHQGARYHPGGIASDGDALWMPVAEYKPDGSTVIQKRSKKTLEVLSQFEVQDHIGCIAAAGGKLLGANWDARKMYQWDPTGKLLDVHTNRTGTAYQDMKAAGSGVVASGLRGRTAGSIDWLSADGLRLIRRVRVGRTDRGVLLTHEGIAVGGDKLYLLPEDAPSRLFVFDLPR